VGRTALYPRWARFRDSRPGMPHLLCSWHPLRGKGPGEGLRFLGISAWIDLSVSMACGHGSCQPGAWPCWPCTPAEVMHTREVYVLQWWGCMIARFCCIGIGGKRSRMSSTRARSASAAYCWTWRKTYLNARLSAGHGDEHDAGALDLVIEHWNSPWNSWNSSMAAEWGLQMCGRSVAIQCVKNLEEAAYTRLSWPCLCSTAKLAALQGYSSSTTSRGTPPACMFNRWKIHSCINVYVMLRGWSIRDLFG